MWKNTVVWVVVVGCGCWAWGQAKLPAPVVYELQINGETFTVEADQQVELKSKTKPGTTYQVALRLAPNQRWAMNGVRFDYDGEFQVEDDNQLEGRTATLTHAQGYILSVIDLNAETQAENRGPVLQKLVDSVSESHRKNGASDVLASPAREVRHGKTVGLESVVTYRDRKGTPSTSRVTVLSPAKGPSAVCILQYPDSQEAPALASARVTFESLQAK